MEKIISHKDLKFYQLIAQLISALDLVPVRAACLPHCGYLAMSLHILTEIAVTNDLAMLEDRKEIKFPTWAVNQTCSNTEPTIKF